MSTKYTLPRTLPLLTSQNIEPSGNTKLGVMSPRYIWSGFIGRDGPEEPPPETAQSCYGSL